MMFLLWCGHVYFSNILVIVLLLWLRHMFEVNFLCDDEIYTHDTIILQQQLNI